jgi:polyphosphate:AMP phosphotransferase
LNYTVGRKEYRQEMNALETRLISLQQQIREYKIPVLIVFEGWSASGKGTLIGKLLNPLDPRYFNVYTLDRATQDAVMRPFLWRYFSNLPSVGRIAIYDKSWHRIAQPEGEKKWRLTEKEIDGFYYDVNAFEEQLASDGILVIKLFLHISKEEQRRRFKEILKNPDTKWRVDEDDLKQNEDYHSCLKRFESMILESNTGLSKWSVVEANDKNYATLKIYKVIISKIEEEIARRIAANEPAAILRQNPITAPAVSILSSIDLDKKISKEEYKEKLAHYQNKMSDLGFKLYTKRRSVVMVYEGWDAAGKGGNIKRMTQELDPRGYEVVPSAAPTQDELNHHYLWRFWNKMPKDGHFAIFDRSWYGRVMVERIEGFCTTEEWQRAYKEINDMEKHMVNHGTVIFKFWIHIDKEEQLKRFQLRQTDPLKQYKITDEDWRNREKWDQYEKAVDEMLFRTNTDYAHWKVIESNDKKYARIKTLEYVVKELEKQLGD